MNLLWIAPQPFYAARGTPMNVRRLAETICGLGHEIDLVTYALGEDVALPTGMRVHRARPLGGVRTVPIGPSLVKLPLDLLLYRRALEVLRGAGRIDCLHGFEEGAWIAAALGARHGKPFVYDMDSDLAEQMRDSNRWLFRRLAPAVAAIDALAQRLADGQDRGRAPHRTGCADLPDRGCAERRRAGRGARRPTRGRRAVAPPAARTSIGTP
jgi:hypothetical protein